MNIEWIKCSERMPPDDGKVILARHPKVNMDPMQLCGFMFHMNKTCGMLDGEWEWTESTPEKWEYLTNELQSTLGNPEWLRKNESALKKLLPPTWTHAQNMNVLKIAFNLKLLGVDWRSEDELGKIMVFLEKTGIMLREGLTCRANPRSIFDDK